MLNEAPRDRDSQDVLEVSLTGQMLLEHPLLNKGSSFPEDERRGFHLLGLLPHHVAPLDEQLQRTYENYRRKDDDLERYIFLASLQDRNEMLFYRLLSDHIREMSPIVYTPVVGLACQNYSHMYRRPRGLYVSYPYRDEMDTLLQNVPNIDVRVIVVTDGERILGLGDLGVGGMGIPVGKLALYTLCAGIHPAVLDVGTNNTELLADPLYLGWHHERVRGADYDAFVERFVQAVRSRFPDALLQWEDFAKGNARRLLDHYRDQLCTFNDDIQGTGAVTLAGLLVAVDLTHSTLGQQRVVILGAGSAATGIAEQVVAAMQSEGSSLDNARRAIWLIDSHGLVHSDRGDLEAEKALYAQPQERIASWPITPSQTIGLPDVIDWTAGRALIATGSPFPDVTFHGRTISIGQCNNMFIFPGVGLGVLATQARHVTNEMFVAAARALSACSPARSDPTASLYPMVEDVRDVARRVAIAVGSAAQQAGVAGHTSPEELERSIAELMWVPHYTHLTYKAEV